jgi:hypothetical protein
VPKGHPAPARAAKERISFEAPLHRLQKSLNGAALNCVCASCAGSIDGRASPGCAACRARQGTGHGTSSRIPARPRNLGGSSSPGQRCNGPTADMRAFKARYSSGGMGHGMTDRTSGRPRPSTMGTFVSTRHNRVTNHTMASSWFGEPTASVRLPAAGTGRSYGAIGRCPARIRGRESDDRPVRRGETAQALMLRRFQ